MASKHLDKLVRSFISGSSNPRTGYSDFADLQDPTFLSFKLDFFPDDGYGFPDDLYSSGGLFRKNQTSSLVDYSFYDSAASYLARIGSPARQHYLEIFINLLYRLQNEAPWYFQSISGLAELYKIDPAMNYRGKDKVLTIECLESIDLRMSLLADLYRNLAFDAQGMREVLPVNLRTFNMNVHVLEFRRFNTTFGVVADALGRAERPSPGQDKQQNAIDSQRRSAIASAVTSAVTGLPASGAPNTNQGAQSGSNPNADLQSAFEAISVQTFVLKDCEFDFFSEAPGYLDTVSVKDINEATHRFKIKVGKIQKTSTYSFYDYVISEYAKYSLIQPANIQTAPGRTFTSSSPYFEETDWNAQPNPKEFYRNYREAIFPTDGDARSASRGSADAYNKYSAEVDALRAQALRNSQDVQRRREEEDAANNTGVTRRSGLENLLRSAVRGLAQNAADQINTGLGNLSGGLIGNEPLGNIYGRQSLARRLREGLNDFLTPGNQLTNDNGSYRPPAETLRNIQFESINLENDISPDNVYLGEPRLNNPVSTGDNIFQGTPTLPTNQGGTDNNIYEGTPDLPIAGIGETNVFNSPQISPVDQEGIDQNIYTGSRSAEAVDKEGIDENVYSGTPLPIPPSWQRRNVFKDE